MTHSDIVISLDKKYAEEPVICPNENKPVMRESVGKTDSYHGAMQVHGSSAYLVCCLCDFKVATAR